MMSLTIQALQKKNTPKKRVNNLPVGGGGRPKGAKNKTTLLREAILQQAEEKVLQEFMNIVQTTVDLAHKGDTTCLKILWDRIIPAKRAIDPDDNKQDKLNVVINISGMETKGVQDVEIIDGEVREVDD